jgi:hypothetical protein
MAAKKGNKQASKWTDDQPWDKIYESYLQNIREGYPKECWCWKDKDPKKSLTHRTFIKYIEDHPDVFPPSMIREAESEGYRLWFKKGIRFTDGDMKGNPSPQTYALIMRNMQRWDSTTGGNVTINVHSKKFDADD